MNAELSALSARLDQVRGRISRAAERSGRPAASIRLVAVVKTVSAEMARAAIGLGIEDLAENRVQEAEDKIDRVGRASEGGRVRWHLIGHLQRNKAGRAARLFDRVHSVDRLELAAALARHAAAAERELSVMIEVNVTGAPGQSGVAPEGLGALARAVAQLPRLALDGLMTIAPQAGGERARPAFARLRELRDGLAREGGPALTELSMGMSGDFEVAIEEGSTMVRIGTALFGARA